MWRIARLSHVDGMAGSEGGDEIETNIKIKLIDDELQLDTVDLRRKLMAIG